MYSTLLAFSQFTAIYSTLIFVQLFHPVFFRSFDFPASFSLYFLWQFLFLVAAITVYYYYRRAVYFWGMSVVRKIKADRHGAMVNYIYLRSSWIVPLRIITNYRLWLPTSSRPCHNYMRSLYDVSKDLSLLFYLPNQSTLCISAKIQILYQPEKSTIYLFAIDIYIWVSEI